MRGVIVKVLNGEYVVPGVTLRLHFDHEQALEALGAASTVPPKEANRLLLEFALAILRQNYPALTREEFLDAAGMADVGAIVGAALPQSGYSRGPLAQRAGNDSPAPTSSDGSSTPPVGDPGTSSTG